MPIQELQKYQEMSKILKRKYKDASSKIEDEE